MIMNMKQKVLVLSAVRYEITDDKGKITNSGCSVNYIVSEDLAVNTEGNLKGHKPAKANLSYQIFDALGDLPAVFDASFTSKVDSSGKINITISDLDFSHMIKVTAAVPKT